MIRTIKAILTKLGISCIVTNGNLKFYCPSFMEMWRAEELFNKEPETIAWIDNFSPMSILWDFGANVGTYTLYAAKKNHTVFAFEPSYREFIILKKNVEINEINTAILCNIFAGEDTDYNKFLNPNYIKIDTDGFEIPILLGLEKRGMLSIAKEVLIEVTPDDYNEIAFILSRNGYKMTQRVHAPMFDGTLYEKYDNAIFVKP